MALDKAGALSDWTISPETSSLLHGSGATGTLRLPAGARAELRLPAGDEPVLLLELRPAGPSAAGLVLILAGEAADDDDTRYALHTLAHQVAAGPEQRRAVGRGSPARERGPVRDARPELERPDHGHRRQQHGALPEPVDRARSRLHGRGGHRPPVRAAAPSRRAGPPAAPPHGRRRRERPRRADRLPAGAPGRHPAPLRDPARRPARRQRGRRASSSTAATSRERKAFEEQLAHQAFHDPVTHLANRALFNERVRHAVARTRREGIGMAVLFVDLDDFKTVNDSLGHAAGDRVLLEVAQRISSERPRGRHRRAVRRRRVRDPARGRRRPAGGGRDRRADPRLARPSARARRQPPRDPRQPRHLGRRAGQCHRCRRADPQRRRRDVHRQGRRQGRLPPVRAGDARPRGGAPRAARRSAAGARARGVRAPLPAARAPRGRGRHRRRGAAALAPPRRAG